MGKLKPSANCQLVAAEKYLVGHHASERVEERGIMEWQAVSGLEEGILIAERPNADPIPPWKSASACPTALNSRRYGRTYDKAALQRL
jgi:hypothetical protein